MTMERPTRILVVDDDMDAAETMAALLTIWGHKTCVAHDGAGALQAAVRFRPDVVFLDIGLPGMDGYSVAQCLRGHPGTEKALLVALTGYAREEDERRSYEAGIDHHLVKPADIDVLQEIVARCEVMVP
jgi:CheY-like chemotaxis protein